MLAAGSGGAVSFSLQNASSGSVVADGLLAIPLADGNDLIVDYSIAGGGHALAGVGNFVAEGVLEALALVRAMVYRPAGERLRWDSQRGQLHGVGPDGDREARPGHVVRRPEPAMDIDRAGLLT